MSTSDFDIGPLTWVKSEIDAALDRARESIQKAQSGSERREPLRFAQTHVHQASGALSVVGLDGVSQFADAIDKLLASLASGEREPDDASITLALRGIAVLANYINELLAGAPHQPLRLFDTFRELVAARGGEAPVPSELFFPDLGVRPALAQARDVDPARAAHELRVMRGRFEKGLLAWIRQPKSPEGPEEMLKAVRRIEQLQALPATRAFWWAAIAFFEGVAQQTIPTDRAAHKLCRRIDTQMRRLIEGSQVVAERLVRDVLYFVATAATDSPHAQAVRQVYRLERLLPSPEAQLSDTLRQPLALRVREALEQAKDSWNRFSAGAAVALPQFVEQLAELSARAAPMRVAQVDRLLGSLNELLGWLRADPLRANEALAMDVATGLLVIEQTNESPNADPATLRRQVDTLCERYAARARGEMLPALDDSVFGETSRRAQEKLFFNQLAREILTNLGQIEQTLDAFFRNSAQRDGLPGLSGPLKQIEGAFAVLGEPRAVQLVREAAQRVVTFAGQSEPPSQDECKDVAHQLSALGFYVEALKTGPAKLEHFLDPDSAKLSDSEVEAVTVTVEAQLARDSRGTQELVEALKEAPQDEGLRQQLVSNLEALREDAHLIADSELEQNARDALASLKSGEVGTAELAEALSHVSPIAAPQPSEETARLMQTSGEELDAELLEIFLEEATEVLETLRSAHAVVSAEPHNVEALTTLRRAYHTFKGSSRMVGLNDFSEAARHVEMTMNRWLQLDKNGSAEILALVEHGRVVFDAWVKQLRTGGSVWYDAAALIKHADDLLAHLDNPDEPPPGKQPVPAAAPAAAVAAAVGGSAPAAGGTKMELDVDLSEDIEPAPAVAPAAKLVEHSLSETTFDFDAFDLPELGHGETRYEASLEETRLDVPSLAALGLDEAPFDVSDEPQEMDLTSTQLTGPATELESPVFTPMPAPVSAPAGDAVSGALTHTDLHPVAEDEVVAEMDLTSSLVGMDLARLERAESDHAEVDLTDSSLDPSMLRQVEDIGQETSLDLPSFAELEAIASGEPREEAVAEGGEELPGDDALTLADLEAREAAEDLPVMAEAVSEAATDVSAPTSSFVTEVVPSAATPVPAEPKLQEVSIEDEAEGDIDLPHINLYALGGEALPDSMAQRVAEIVNTTPPPASDSEVTLGEHTISRGLFDMYMGEARQHLAVLREEIGLLQANPLRTPSAASVRAAHTLAGISGTARIEPVQALAKALEHALHHFCDVGRTPDLNQTAVMATAVSTLEAMVAEVERMSVPLLVPELVDQLDNLRPQFDAPREPAPLEPAPIAQANEAPAAVTAYDLPEPEPVVIAAADDEDDEPLHTVQDDLDEQLLPIFFEEADELTAEIEATLRQLRSQPDDAEAMKSLARSLHTFKGSARMAGAMRLGEYIHELETHIEADLLAQKAGPQLVDQMENGIDAIGSQLALLKDPSAAVQAPAQAASAMPTVEEEAAISFGAPVFAEAPAADAPVAHSMAVQPIQLAPPPVDEIEPAQVRPNLRVRADLIDRFVNEAGEISIARTRVEGEMRTLRRSLLDLTENVIRLRNQLREVEISAESQMQSRIAAAESQHAEFDPLEFDRFTRLQEVTRMMAESVGDVTTIQQNLLRNLDAADTALHSQGRLSRDLQQALMGVRMVPFDDLADRLHRVVRQTAKELGKRANLDIRGGRIEIDRSVLDRMTAPIEHLLRNAIAHGVETPDVRSANGKSEIGQITITLTQRSNEISLAMADDGRGLNYERILARGREAGFVQPGDQPSDSQLTQLIFEPGFSTAETVSGVAGRGVGMDVVKNETLAVGGRIDVSSTPGQGAQFLIHLPLTLAVTQALLVRAGGRTYAVPSNMVEQALELKETPLQEVRDRGYAEWKTQQYPFRYLPRLLGDTATQPEQGRFHWVLLLRAGNETLAMHIDELRGNQEIVVKNAGPQFTRLQGYTGATVLPDGEIALILNPVVLAGRYRSSEEQGGSDEFAPVADTYEVPTVMVVDDSLTVRKITSRLLEREGYRVVTAKDGVDALEQLVELKPDVMLLDIEMPRMDGFDLARNVRADDKLNDIPLIMITSRMADKHRNYAMEIGVNHYLGKPYQEEHLLELIAGFIAAARR
ncbi:hybrid sensor histidine kinase/response regulator [Uliginosibacterium sp. H1]|uniref:hybrid sensor histidine kinase/response regulator n=1 Tax=Uliginosibacterium sp. H1 TaxID=3114757 RepID=UPI002E1935E3|nr:Hpt domain-containing protein [Uliginosibacterium sp. H1]